MKRIIALGLLGGVLLAVLKFIEYQHFVRAYPTEIYGGVIALIFSSLGVWMGLRWSHRRQIVVTKTIRVPSHEPFEVDASALERLGITPREHEILGLIAEGLSNREIGERLFVSENTIKTHSSRLFQKMGVARRTQAVQKGKELSLIP